MKVKRGIAAGSIIAACLSVFAGCIFDWDLKPLASANDDASTASDAPTSSSDVFVEPMEASPNGCSTNSDCASGLCYFPSGGPTCAAGTGTCVAPSVCSAVGTGPSGSVNNAPCGCSNLADACAPAGGVAKCTDNTASETPCGFLDCPSATAFCEISTTNLGTKYECRSWAVINCGTSQHTCNCAKRICDAGGTCDSTQQAAVTCQ